jgi:hypothetical protein
LETQGSDSRSSRSLNLTTGGVTLIGVLLSIGVTVGFGVSGEWWLRVASGTATTVVLVFLVKMATSSGRGPLAHAANWVIGTPDEDRR